MEAKQEEEIRMEADHQSTNTEEKEEEEVDHQPSTCPSDEPKSTLNQKEIFKVLEVVERDSIAIAASYKALFSSLRLALSEVTSTSVDHMQCFGDAAGRLQESVLEAATKGNRYINSCLRLNEEMKGINTLAAQLKILRRNVDSLDTAVNRLVRFQ